MRPRTRSGRTATGSGHGGLSVRNPARTSVSVTSGVMESSRWGAPAVTEERSAAGNGKVRTVEQPPPVSRRCVAAKLRTYPVEHVLRATRAHRDRTLPGAVAPPVGCPPSPPRTTRRRTARRTGSNVFGRGSFSAGVGLAGIGAIGWAVFSVVVTSLVTVCGRLGGSGFRTRFTGGDACGALPWKPSAWGAGAWNTSWRRAPRCEPGRWGCRSL